MFQDPPESLPPRQAVGSPGFSHQAPGFLVQTSPRGVRDKVKRRNPEVVVCPKPGGHEVVRMLRRLRHSDPEPAPRLLCCTVLLLTLLSGLRGDLVIIKCKAWTSLMAQL